MHTRFFIPPVNDSKQPPRRWDIILLVVVALAACFWLGYTDKKLDLEQEAQAKEQARAEGRYVP